MREWTPLRVRVNGGQPTIHWAIVDAPFSEAFFEQTAERAMAHPFNQVFARRTALAALEEVDVAAGLAPSGFIFHMSRSGSTLIAQMLSKLDATLVLAEPQPVDGLLRLRKRIRDSDEETLIRLLRAMIAALAVPRRGERRLFVKFHAWHVLELPFILRAFPGVPWIFVFRNPDDVLRSQARNPGAEIIAGTIDPAYVGMTAVEALGAADYGARVIAAFCDAALRNAGDSRSAFVDYERLPAAVSSTILEHFGVAPTNREIVAMREAERVDAKGAGEDFRPRPSGLESDGTIREGAARRLDALYAVLRQAQDDEGRAQDDEGRAQDDERGGGVTG